MPQVLYTAAKGLYQQSGSGFTVSDVAIAEASETVAFEDSGANLAAYGTSTLSGDTDATLATLPDGSTVGAIKLLLCDDVGGGNPEVTVTNGIQDDGTTALDTLTFSAVTQHAALVWNGSAWLCYSTTATEG